MQTWYECVVKFIKIDDDGREKKVSESYLFDCVSFTDAEARIAKEMGSIIRGEYVVDKISKSRIIEIFPHETGEFWWKGKISIVTIDEKAGKEKVINNFFLVAADDLEQALKRLKEGLSYVLVPYQITSLVLSPIVDVFPYFDENKAIPSNLKPIEKADVLDELMDELPEVYNSDDEITDVEFEDEEVECRNNPN